MSAISYHGRRFQPAGAAPAPELDLGPASTVPTGQYYQDSDVVRADYSGGPIQTGRLVARCRPDGVLEAAYCHVTNDGSVVAGRCVSTPTLLPDGRLRVEERWRRCDGTTGVSWIEEMAA